MSKFLKWYFLAWAVIMIAGILVVLYDIIHYAMTGAFTVFPALNMVRFETVEDAWAYIDTLYLWGDNVFQQSYAHSFFKLCSMKVIWATIAYFTKYLKEKWLYMTLVIALCAVAAIGILFTVFIDGCASQFYILKVFRLR